jgi:hypothetical protein
MCNQKEQNTIYTRYQKATEVAFHTKNSSKILKGPTFFIRGMGNYKKVCRIATMSMILILFIMSEFLLKLTACPFNDYFGYKAIFYN